MTSRRTLLFGLGNVLLGGAAVTRGALSAFARPTSDMRVITSARCPPPGLRLEPGRDDEAYVVTDGDGTVEEFVLDGTGSVADGLNENARTRFERLVRVYNEVGVPVEELTFEFQVLDKTLQDSDPSPTAIENALFIASEGGDIPGHGSADFIAATDHGQLTDDQIGVGEGLTFGIGVDLLDSGIQELPDPSKFRVRLLVEARAADVEGCVAEPPPGAKPPACPLSPSITVDVAAGADDERVKAADITILNEDIDGEVRTTSGSDGDITIKRANIAGPVTADSGIGTLQDATVGGDVTARGGDIGGAVKRSEIDGDLRTAPGSDGDIDIKDAVIAGVVSADSEIGTLQDATIEGDVTASNDIGDAIKRSKIGGDVVSGSDGDIDIQDSTVCGKLESGGEIGKLKDTSVGGDISARGDIDANKSTVFGEVIVASNSDGDVSLINDTVIKGDIEADGAKGDVSLSQSTVEGTIYADGDVDVKAGSTVEGDIQTEGDVTVQGTVKGGVFTTGAVDGNGTIQGFDPR